MAGRGSPVWRLSTFFLRKLQRYGFAIALLLYAKLRWKSALAILLVNCLVLFDWIVIWGRRGPAVELVLFLVCTCWFAWRRTLPRWGMLVLLAAGALAVGGVEAYRNTMYKDQVYGGALRHEVPWDEILKIDFMEEFLTYNQEASFEFRNCAYCIHTTKTFDVGLSCWNEVAYAYVPAQVVGWEFKNSLRIDLPGEVAHPDSPPGTTSTGMADSFQAFGWFGCLIFFWLAFAMRKLFETAQTGHLVAQLAYMLIVTSSLHTITHHTKCFLTPWIHMAVFLLPCLLWARKNVSRLGQYQTGT